jgi:hypothetical protein
LNAGSRKGRSLATSDEFGKDFAIKPASSAGRAARIGVGRKFRSFDAKRDGVVTLNELYPMSPPGSWSWM